MNGLLRKGWDMTVRHKYVLVLLFLYRLLWGFLLYRIIDAAVTPVLSRFPSEHPNANAVQLFLIEAQFRIMRTDLIQPILWMLGGMLFLRMFLTPVLNAGIYYSFHHAYDSEGTRMLPGIRRAWKSVTALYWAENLLTLLPAAWFVPFAKETLFTKHSIHAWLAHLTPYAAGWLLYGFALHLLFQFMQFGAVSREGIGKSMLGAIRRALPLLAVTLALVGIGLLASAAASAVSIAWSGFAAVVLHQAFQLVRSLVTLWTAASQYQVWRESV